FAAAGLATLALAAAVAVPWLAVVTLALEAALVAVVALDARRAARVRLEAERVWPTLLVQGMPGAVLVRVRADAATVVLGREALHPGVAAAPVRTRLAVGPAVPALWRYEVVPRRRGAHRVGPLTVRVLGPWGFACMQPH